MTRTTRADLTNLTRAVQDEAQAAGILQSTDRLALITGSKTSGEPYRLRTSRNGVLVPFEPADGNGGDIGRTAREAENTLRIIWSTLIAARKARQ